MNRRDLLKAALAAGLAPALPNVAHAARPAKADAPAAAPHWTAESDVVWDTPSPAASPAPQDWGGGAGSMPLGNGQVGVNLWAEEGGDLVLLISRTDSFSEIARIVKVGQVRVSLSPNPFAAGQPFRQHLRLADGVCEFAAGRGAQKVTLRVFVDADAPVIHVVGAAAGPVRVQAKIENWRDKPHVVAPGDEQSSAWTMNGAPFPLIESADVLPNTPPHAVAWYHRNEVSTAFTATMRVQSLQSAASTVHDPLLHRTFGGWVTGPEMTAAGPGVLETAKPVHAFALQVAAPCAQTATAAAWLTLAQTAAARSADPAVASARTAAWWRAYWDRAWVVVSGDKGRFVIPGADHPLRIGYDSNHQNVFPGQITGALVNRMAYTAADIQRLAQSDPLRPAPDAEVGQVDAGATREFAANTLDFARGLTIAAWIKTDGSAPGRIFDKLTAGQDDGFLFDTYPKDALRLIVGDRQIQTAPGTLPLNSWQHVAATMNAKSGAMAIYLNGKMVASLPGNKSRSPVTQGYTLQRYVQACGGRGPYPIKFNGGMFTVAPTVDGHPWNADWRAWGDPHWYQNIRHMYHPMPAAGDREMILPFFHMYEAARPLAEARTRLYHNAEGAYFPETMTVWGTYANSDYGWDRNGKKPQDVNTPWWRWAWNQGPELTALMLDHWDHTQDAAFLQTRLLPMAVSVLTYFDTRFAKDADGRVILDPDQAIETFWSGVINDMPTTAGLHAVTARLCALPTHLTTPQQRAFFAHMQKAAPVLPMEQVTENGQSVPTLAPAQKYDSKRTNCENPELYAVWPFRLYGVGRPGLDIARRAYARRVNHLPVGWGYDGNVAAVLGLADEAARIMQIKCANSNPKHRWPATWGPNFDWLPDQNHGGNLLETTQLMLLQAVGEKLYLLPAWPKDWDVSFKLHAPQNTTVECVYKAGKIEQLTVTPEARRKDVVVGEV